MRDRLIELLRVPIYPKEGADPAEVVADYLLDSGVIVPPCKAGDTDYKIMYEHLLEDFEHALHFAEKNNNVCDFCEFDRGEGGTCKGRENRFECHPKWRGIEKSKGGDE